MLTRSANGVLFLKLSALRTPRFEMHDAVLRTSLRKSSAMRKREAVSRDLGDLQILHVACDMSFDSIRIKLEKQCCVYILPTRYDNQCETETSKRV